MIAITAIKQKKMHSYFSNQCFIILIILMLFINVYFKSCINIRIREKMH